MLSLISFQGYAPVSEAGYVLASDHAVDAGHDIRRGRDKDETGLRKGQAGDPDDLCVFGD